MNSKLVLAVMAAVIILLGAAIAQDSPYVGADACKTCHEAIHGAWSGTAHARALLRLSAQDRESGQCIGCHVTGSPEQIAAEGANPSLPGVQCEACHGPGRKHAETAAAGTPQAGTVARTPDAKACTRCHNDKSPHYSPFFYAAMKSLVHRVR